MPDGGTVLAFDFGTRRIGVAVGESLTGSANPLATIDAGDNATRFARISALIGAWQPRLLVVGLPCRADGSESDMTARCRRFARQLQCRFGLAVHLVDESYSSAEADRRLAARGLDWRARKREVDAAAAAIILQDYFDASPKNLAA